MGAALSDISELAERVAQACRVLARLELTRAATGHVSARIPGTDRLLIRARGPNELGVRYTSVEQVIECDFDGKIVGSTGTGLAAPLEVFIHTEIYKARPEIFSVIHMHPPTIMLFSICCKPLLPLYGAYDPSSARLAIDGIPQFDRSILINNAALGAELAKVMGHSKTCMMRGHGITTAGASVEQAALYAIQLNELATINYQAQLLGDPQPISSDDQAAMLALRVLESTSEGGLPPSGGDAAVWNYFCRFTDS